MGGGGRVVGVRQPSHVISQLMDQIVLHYMSLLPPTLCVHPFLSLKKLFVYIFSRQDTLESGIRGELIGEIAGHYMSLLPNSTAAASADGTPLYLFHRLGHRCHL